jgi:hypothetical protein
MISQPLELGVRQGLWTSGRYAHGFRFISV